MRNETLTTLEAQAVSPYQTRQRQTSPMLDLIITLAFVTAIALSAFAFTSQRQISQAVQDTIHSYDQNSVMANGGGNNWNGG